MQGAGGTQGGILRFFLGLVMFVMGGYLFLSSIYVHSGFGWGHGLYNMGGYGITGGILMIPFVFGVGLLFYNSRNPVGWVLSAGSLLALIFGVLRSLRFTFRHMNLIELLIILVLLFGGLGLFLSAFRSYDR